MSPASARRPLYVLGALAVIAGLFLMHGVGTHGDASRVQMTSAHATTSLAGEAAGQTVPALPSATVATLAPPADHAGWTVAETTAICLSILGVGLIMLLVALRCGRSTPLASRRPPVTRIVAAKGRRPAPPSLTLLSIQRC